MSARQIQPPSNYCADPECGHEISGAAGYTWKYCGGGESCTCLHPDERQQTLFSGGSSNGNEKGNEA